MEGAEIAPMPPEGTPPSEGSFHALPILPQYLCRADRILGEFILPVLGRASEYDRITSYFDVASLVAVAQGIDALWKRGGRMRLIIGVHDVPVELLQARLQGRDLPGDVFRALRERLLAEASTIRDEFRRDRLATLAWMLRDGLLEVRVALLVDAKGEPTQKGIFHPKRLLFRSSEADERVAAVGSPNETLPGLSANIEDLIVLRSWVPGQAELVEAQFSLFESIWKSETVDFVVKELDIEFAVELLRRVGKPIDARPPEGRAKSGGLIECILQTAIDSPSYAMVAMGSTALFPHQEMAYLDALGRWPVRTLLADEVGLGKTLEAGAVINYLHRFAGVSRIAILVPSSLVIQWQEELALRFGIRAWRYESSERAFIDPDLRIWRIPAGESPVGPKSPQIVIISSQLARGGRGAGPLFMAGEPSPDLIVLDEAHHARVRPEVSGRRAPTLLWSLMSGLAKRVPHIVLLSATPMQLHWSEYQSTLSLLGLPSEWRSEAAFEDSLELMAHPDDKPPLYALQHATKALRSTVTELEVKAPPVSKSELQLLERLTSQGAAGDIGQLVEARKRWDETYSILGKLHPAHLLTIRRTRRTLKGLGYFFPKRLLRAPPLEVPSAVIAFNKGIQGYLTRAYGATERTANPESWRGQGFARVIYFQRLASSLNAARISLRRRETWLKIVTAACEDGRHLEPPTDPTGQEDEEAEDEPGILQTIAQMDRALRAQVRAMAELEQVELQHLTGLLDEIPQGDFDGDPKLACMVELLAQHIPGDRALVFSRYTDTVNACVSAFRNRHSPGSMPGIGVYTGGEHWLDLGRGEFPASKVEITEALDEGRISVVFCSDAASEGLNLQAARVVINVDVPWNPAKLEQRIGRIDRLGQTAPEVLVFNLWYPESVEARMYGRLIERHDLYELAVGEAPEVIAAEIHAQLGGELGMVEDPNRPDPLETLQRLREELQRRALIRILERGAEAAPLSARFRKELLSLVVDIATARQFAVRDLDGGVLDVTIGQETWRVSNVVGRQDCISLGHPLVRILLPLAELARVRARGSPASLGVLRCGATPCAFVISVGCDHWAMQSAEWPRLVQSLRSGEPCSLEGAVQFVVQPDGRVSPVVAAHVLRQVSPWLPDGRALRPVWPEETRSSQAAPPLSEDDWTVDELGRITAIVRPGPNP